MGKGVSLETTYRRGELARLSGCNAETIRYYEKIGLLTEPARTPSGYRIYANEHVRRLKFIQRAKSLGFSTDQVRQLLTLSDDGDVHTRAEVKQLTENHIEEVTGRIKDLQKLKRKLLEISSHCDGSRGSARQCPILDSLFSE